MIRRKMLMRPAREVRSLVVVMLLALIAVACSGGSGSHSDIGGESVYDPGAPVAAVNYQDSCPIVLRVLSGSGEYVRVDDGQYVEPGKRMFEVEVVGDSSDIMKVLVSDGGMRQVEAVRQGSAYQCEFTIDDERLYRTLLVQVIHSDERASKEKFVIRTVRGAQDDALVLNGLGIAVSPDMLDICAEQLAPVLDQVVGETFAYMKEMNPKLITKLEYGDHDPDTVDVVVNALEIADDAGYPDALLRLVFTVGDVDITAMDVMGENMITTTGNDLTVDTYVVLEDQDADGRRCLAFDFLGSAVAAFSRDIFLRQVLEEEISKALDRVETAPLAADLDLVADALMGALPGSIVVNDAVVDVRELTGDLHDAIGKLLFLDLYGIPTDPSQGFTAFGAGVHVADKDEVDEFAYDHGTPGGGADMDAMFTDICTAMVDDAFEAIRQKYDGIVTMLRYGDGDSATGDVSVDFLDISDGDNPQTKNVRVQLTIRDVDFNALELFGIPLISTRDNDLLVDAVFLLTSRSGQDGHEFVIDMKDVVAVGFSDYFIGRAVVEGMVAQDLNDLETMIVDLDDLIADLDLLADLSHMDAGGYEFPDVEGVLSPYSWELGLLGQNNVSVAVSQDSINRVLEGLLPAGCEWDAYEIMGPILGDDFPGFAQGRDSNEETVLRLSVPPVLDLRGSRIRMQLDDMILEYRLDGQPQWRASMDLDLILTIEVLEGEIALFVTPIPGNCHFHMMRDNPGNLGLLDHSNLVSEIIENLPVMLGSTPSGPVATVALEALEPGLTLDQVQTPVSITAAEGYLYLDMAILDMDISWVTEIFAR